MPSTMTHILAGKFLLPEGSDEFFLGCILPDCVDADRALKDRLHFRDIPPEERISSIAEFASKLDIDSCDFDFGMLWHFFLDRQWDEGPQKKHRENYKGETWFKDYRKEIALCGSYIAHHWDFAIPLMERLKKFCNGGFSDKVGFPEEMVHEFLTFNRNWHQTVNIGPSQVFTPEITEEFIKDSITEFIGFLNKYFPDSQRAKFFNAEV